jgi:nicotinic acid mononucleotide adenylyltransferase
MRVVTHELLVETNISSTKIRERVGSGLPVEPFVVPGVASYISEHGLYRTEAQAVSA